ncbi:MAG: VOC family protein [Microthrixaceae bacterium]
MGRLAQIVIDCRNPAGLARFWAAALDGFDVLPYDDDEISRLAALGLTPETDTCVIVVGPDLELCFREVDEGAIAKAPIHLDISTTNLDSEVDRLVGLGATIKHRFDDHVWMCDPEGGDFCATNQRERA